MDTTDKTAEADEQSPTEKSRDVYKIQLSSLERKILITLAVTGEEESLEALTESTGLDPAEIETALDILVNKGIIARTSGAAETDAEEDVDEDHIIDESDFDFLAKRKPDEEKGPSLPEEEASPQEEASGEAPPGPTDEEEGPEEEEAGPLPEGPVAEEETGEEEEEDEDYMAVPDLSGLLPPDFVDEEEEQAHPEKARSENEQSERAPVLVDEQPSPEQVPLPEEGEKKETAPPEEDTESAFDPLAPVPMEAEALAAYLSEIKKLNYYQMLGLPADASRKKIRSVYFDLVSIYHPDQHSDITDKKTRSLLSDIFSTLTNAYETLHKKKPRLAYDRTIPEFTGIEESEEEEALSALFDETGDEAHDQDEAEEMEPAGWAFYQTALNDFQMGNYQDAELNFKLAAAMEPDRPEYKEGLAKTREILHGRMLEELMKEGAKLEEERRFKEAVSAFSRAAAINHEDPEIHYALARLRFLKTMEREKAEENISWALALAPNHVDALLLFGRIQAWKQDKEGAVKTFKKVLDIDPEHKKAHQALELFNK